MAKPYTENANRPSLLSSALSILSRLHRIPPTAAQNNASEVAPNRPHIQLLSVIPLATRMNQDYTTLTSHTEPLIQRTTGISPPFNVTKSHRSMVRTYLKYRGTTFQTILDDNGGAGMGFDVLRLALATLILLTHCSWIVGTSGITTSILNMIFHITPQTVSRMTQATMTVGDPTVHQLTGLGRPITMSYLPMFFALSGFLVTGSALRTRRLIPFLGLRVLRLLPALFVEVTLSAIILGAIFTPLRLSQYYTSPLFWRYFLNIVGEVNFYLPGVFTNNTTNVINSNLWTLPWELRCYIAMSFMIILGLVYHRKVLSILFGVATIVLIYASMVYGFQVVPAQVAGPTLVYYFVAGVLMFLWRDKIVFHEVLFVVSGVVCYVMMMSSRTVFMYPVFLTYITVFIGLCPFPRLAFIKSGDYSYGIYLYGFPVTQALLAGFPVLHKNFAVTAPLAVLATIVFAALSWHGIEKHCLKLRRYISPKSSKIAAALHPTAFSG
jgi:peptidoglycan/LPS O-acetylase OafA/YrhL